MAVIIEVSIQLNRNSSGAVPEARFWVDSQCELGLNSEIELPLSQQQKHCWTGTMALDHKTPQFLYRLGLLAHTEAMWTLSIRNRTQGYTLLSDSDEVGPGKSWLTGVCSVAQVREHIEARTAGAGPNVAKPPPPASRAQRPYLLLLDR